MIVRLAAAFAAAALMAGPAAAADEQSITEWAKQTVDATGWAPAGGSANGVALVPEGREPGAAVAPFQLQMRVEFREPAKDPDGHEMRSLLDTLEVDCAKAQVRSVKQERHSENNLKGETWTSEASSWRPMTPNDGPGSYALSACPAGALPPGLLAAFANKQAELQRNGH